MSDDVKALVEAARAVLEESPGHSEEFCGPSCGFAKLEHALARVEQGPRGAWRRGALGMPEALTTREHFAAGWCATLDEAKAAAERAAGLRSDPAPVAASSIPYRVEQTEGGTWRAETIAPRIGATGPTREGALAYLHGRLLATAALVAAGLRGES